MESIDIFVKNIPNLRVLETSSVYAEYVSFEDLSVGNVPEPKAMEALQEALQDPYVAPAQVTVHCCDWLCRLSRLSCCC